MPGGHPNNNTKGLNRGNPGNKGGGVTHEMRETRQAWLDAINGAQIKDSLGRPIAVSEAIKATIISNATNPSEKFQTTRLWLVEMQHGKAHAKTELVVADGQFFHALAHALYEEKIDPDTSDRIIDKVRTLLSAEPG